VPGGHQGPEPTKIKIEKNQVLVSGRFLETLDYWKDGISQNVVLNTNNGTIPSNNFLLKIDNNGILNWNMYVENQANNQNYRDIIGMDIDNSKNIYVAGVYESQVKIHDVGNINNLVLSGSSGDGGSYILKLDSTGKLIWKVNLINNFNLE